MIKKFFIIFFTLLSSLLTIHSQNYIPGKIIVKFKEGLRPKCQKNSIYDAFLIKFLNDYKVIKTFKIYPDKEKPAFKTNKAGHKLADLSLIYEFEFPANADINKIICKIKSLGLVEYAVPHYLPQLLYAPNDTFTNRQYYLRRIKAFDAWYISKGDTNVLIGIVDTGIDTLHPDLKPNIKKGGWNVADNNSNIQSDLAEYYHGDCTAGIAGAAFNNKTGIAGIGAKCKILPVKINKYNTTKLVNVFQGIVYAADMGCSVINCSWGGVYPPSPYEQDIINYVTINKNALVIASAGNDNSENVYYPASYKYVLSIAATDSNDYRKNDSHGSTYGANIDISAPGTDVFTTINTVVNNPSYPKGYTSTGGTSVSAPVVSGCAAILKSYFPSYDAVQIGEQLKVTADDIYNLTPNTPFKNKLGYGRVNLYRALTIDTLPSIVMIYDSISDKNANILMPGDTAFVYGNFINYLHESNNAVCTLHSKSPYIQVLDSIFTIGKLATYATLNNFSSPFRIKILPGAPLNTVVNLLITYSDGSYYGYNWLKYNINKTWVDINVNSVGLSVTNTARLGYNDMNHLQGIGFSYNDTALTYLGGLMIGVSSTKVSDVVYSDTLGKLKNNFVNLSFNADSPGSISDFDVNGSFNDYNAGANKLNIVVAHNEYAFKKADDSKFIILEYNIKNNGVDTLKNLYAGLYNDFDIFNNYNNIASFDPANKMGYTYSLNLPLYAGVRLLTDNIANFYALNNDGSGSSVKITDGFTKAEKFTTLSTSRNNSLTGEISQTLSGGPFIIPPKSFITVAFAMLGSGSFNDLTQSGIAAKAEYDNIVKTRHYILDGTLSYDNSPKNTPLKSVKLYLKDSTDIIIDSAITDTSGYYIFSNIPYGNYSLLPAPSSLPKWSGVNPIDALQINRYYIKIFSFSDDLRKLAANVNLDANVNPVDALLVNRRYIKVLTSFPKGDWLFENPLISVKNNTTQNLKALCFGDVNGDYKF